MYALVCRDDTWGQGTVVEKLKPTENFADAKAIVVQSVDLQVRGIRARAIEPKVYMLQHFPYSVVVEWKPEGADGVIATLIYAVEEV